MCDTELNRAVMEIIYAACDMPRIDVEIGLYELDRQWPGYFQDVNTFIYSDREDGSKQFNIAHDIYGCKSGSPYFLPRLTGYTQRVSS
jgi:hypothetical protein